MHTDAHSRLRELVKNALNGIVVSADQRVDFKSSYLFVDPLQQFLAKNLAKWVHDDYASIYSYLSINEVLSQRGLLSTSGALTSSASPEQRAQAADDICTYWVNVPQVYTFKFPLPSFLPLEADVSIAPGVVLTNAQRSEVDDEQMGLPITLSGLMGVATPTPCACLQVEASGLMRIGDSTEIPAASAIRTTKIVLALAKVLGIFFALTPAINSPRYVTYTVRQGLGFESGRASLPGAFANSLKGCAITQPSNPPTLANLAFIRSLEERLSAVGVVIQGDATFGDMKQPPKTDTSATADYRIRQHCARIATAAEWLFDAETEVPTAMTFVQVSIAFEALYGGSKDDAIGRTLSNRVAYSLGKSPASREEYISEFLDFYGTRSIVVHSGATRLTKLQRTQFANGKQMLRQCLRHEMGLLNPDSASAALTALR
jgi:hypothetical protein